MNRDQEYQLHHVHKQIHVPLSLPLFPFVSGEVLPATFSPPHLLVFPPPLSPVLFFQSPSSPAFFTSLLTQSSHLSHVLALLLLPCSRNSVALFGSLSSAILSSVQPNVMCSSPVSLSGANHRLTLHDQRP